jgi:hypothetical protein
MFQPFTNIGTIGHVGTITNKADSAHYTVGIEKNDGDPDRKSDGPRGCS